MKYRIVKKGKLFYPEIKLFKWKRFGRFFSDEKEGFRLNRSIEICCYTKNKALEFLYTSKVKLLYNNICDKIYRYFITGYFDNHYWCMEHDKLYREVWFSDDTVYVDA
jgi:hypothetical protein